jgi:hypothetical protein
VAPRALVHRVKLAARGWGARHRGPHAARVPPRGRAAQRPRDRVRIRPASGR